MKIKPPPEVGAIYTGKDFRRRKVLHVKMLGPDGAYDVRWAPVDAEGNSGRRPKRATYCNSWHAWLGGNKEPDPS